MYPSYRNGLTIERINNDLNYSKKNCKWIPKSKQALNTRRTKDAIRYKGFTVKEWSEMTGIKKTTIYQRLNYGWSFIKAIGGQIDNL